MKSYRYFVLLFLVMIYNIDGECQNKVIDSLVIDMLTNDDFYWNELCVKLAPFDTIYFEYSNLEKDTILQMTHLIANVRFDTIRKKDILNKDMLDNIVVHFNDSDLLLIKDTIIIDTVYNIFVLSKKNPDVEYFHQNMKSFLRNEYMHFANSSNIPLFYINSERHIIGKKKYLRLTILKYKSIIYEDLYFFEDENYYRSDFYDFYSLYSYETEMNNNNPFNIDLFELINFIERDLLSLVLNKYSKFSMLPDTLHYNSPFYNIDTVIDYELNCSVFFRNDSLLIPEFNYFEKNYHGDLCASFDNDLLCYEFQIKRNCKIKIFSDNQLHNKLKQRSFIYNNEYYNLHYIDIKYFMNNKRIEFFRGHYDNYFRFY